MRWITTGYDDMVWLSNAHSCLIPEWLLWNNAETAKISIWKTGFRIDIDISIISVKNISIRMWGIKQYFTVSTYWNITHCKILIQYSPHSFTNDQSKPAVDKILCFKIKKKNLSVFGIGNTRNHMMKCNKKSWTLPH